MTIQLEQLDYQERNVGKQRPESKKEVTFRLRLTSTEHPTPREFEVILKWSFSSGKQVITVNASEAVFRSCHGASLIDVKFEHELLDWHLIGTRTPPKGAHHFDYKSFELFVGGVLLRGPAGAAGHELQESILDLLYPKRGEEEKGHRLQSDEPVPNVPRPEEETGPLQIAPPVVMDLLGDDCSSAPQACHGADLLGTSPTSEHPMSNVGMTSNALVPSPQSATIFDPLVAQVNPFDTATVQTPIQQDNNDLFAQIVSSNQATTTPVSVNPFNAYMSEEPSNATNATSANESPFTATTDLIGF